MRSLIVLVMLALVAPAAAQPRSPAERREAIKKRIRAMRAYTLTEELSLDDKLAGRLFPVLARWDDVTDKLLVARADLAQKLAQADAIKDPRAVDRLIDDAVANQKAFWDLEDKRLAELRKILTPAQVAKLLIVLPEFERKIQNRLQRVTRHRPARLHAGQPPGARDLDEHDDANDTPPPAPARRTAPPTSPAPQPPCDVFSSRHGCPRR